MADGVDNFDHGKARGFVRELMRQDPEYREWTDDSGEVTSVLFSVLVAFADAYVRATDPGDRTPLTHLSIWPGLEENLEELRAERCIGTSFGTTLAENPPQGG